MENEEKEDLLIRMTESESDVSDKSENDFYVEEKIREFVQNEKQHSKSKHRTLLFVLACLLTFLSSSLLIVTLPMYLQLSRRAGIGSYSKLVTFTAGNAVLFTALHIVGNLISPCTWTVLSRHLQFPLCLPSVVKISILGAVGSVMVFGLSDANLVACHLQDPLKGCAVVFSLLFYFILSQRKMSVERMFCSLTALVGVFVTVDYGLCDRFRCYGNDFTSAALPHESPAQASLHFIHVVLYIVAHGAWVLQFTYLENSCYAFHGSSLCVEGAGKLRAPSQSLSFISREDSGRGQPPPPFPRTSTPNPGSAGWRPWSLSCSLACSLPGSAWPVAPRCVLLWQHWACLLLVLAGCWLPTLHYFHHGGDRLLSDVAEEAWLSVQCHVGRGGAGPCERLAPTAALVLAAYAALMVGATAVLSLAGSAATLLCLLMNALPVAGLWWSLWRLDTQAAEMLQFQPEVSGEAVCAMLGFPIIGVGTVLLVKAHLRELHLL